MATKKKVTRVTADDALAVNFGDKITIGEPKYMKREDFDSFIHDSYNVYTFDTRAKFDKASDKINQLEEVMDLRHSDLHRRNRLLEKRVRDLEALVPSFWWQVIMAIVWGVFVLNTFYFQYVVVGQLDRIRAVVSGNCMLTDTKCTYFVK
jgi:hypothetical protein